MSTPSAARPPAQPERSPRWRVEGHRPQPQQQPRRPMGFGARLWLAILVLLAVNIVASTFFTTSPPSRLNISYTYFQQQVADGNVSQITSTGNTVEGDFAHKTGPPKGMSG